MALEYTPGQQQNIPTLRQKRLLKAVINKMKRELIE